MIPGSPIEDTGSMILRLLRGRGNGVMPTMQPPAQPPAQPTPTPQQTVPPLDSPPTPRVAPTSALLSRAEKIKNPFLKTLGTLGAGALNVADRLGSGLFPEFTALTPGTSLNTTLGNQGRLRNWEGEQQLETQRLALAPKLEPPKDAWKAVTGTNYEINEPTGETRPMPGVPAPTSKSRMQQKILVGPDNQPMAANFDPATGKYFDASGTEINNPQPWEKQSLKPQAVTVNGKPAEAIFDPQKGWLDSQTNQPIKGTVQPMPTYAETGLWEPTEVPDGKGGMVPGRFNRRTGQTEVIPAGQNVPISGAAQKQIDSSLEAAREADNRYKTMTENETDALKGNQQAMLSLVANHIGMTLGQQKGARINQAVWNEAIASTPWLQGVKAKFDSRGYLSGVTLTPDQIKQMVDLASQKRQIQWQQAKDAATQYGVPDAVKIPQDLAGAQSGPTGIPSFSQWKANQKK